MPKTQPVSHILLPLLTAALIYAAYWQIDTTDISNSYGPWIQHIGERGPLRAFAEPFGDYAPPYYYLLALLSLARGFVSDLSLVKLASVISVLLLALAVWRLLHSLGVAQADRFAAWVPVLPTIAINAAVTASCDGLWAAPCVMALAMAQERRHKAMLLWCGLALAVKVQAIFMAPFVLALLIARRVPVHHWFLAPLAAVAAYLPAWLCGWPAADLATIYLHQAGFSEKMSLNAPNIWAIVQLYGSGNLQMLSRIALAAAVAASLAYIALLARRQLEGPALVAAATLSSLIVVGLLPHMHERYFFLADVLAFALAATLASRRAWIDAALVQAGSALGIYAYIVQEPWLAAAGAVPMFAATWRLAEPFVGSGPAETDSVIRQAPATL
ncbi:MAG: hypothetical protein ABIQ32_05295 [Sphingomicrobium sp.]